ncbi:hypothetical protein BDR26DRAFT_928076 [Obelidium mucronatum]|nr:hypothetical protein BDR26DRAFT_928076 [Obelidium mucronatum]
MNNKQQEVTKSMITHYQQQSHQWLSQYCGNDPSWPDVEQAFLSLTPTTEIGRFAFRLQQLCTLAGDHMIYNTLIDEIFASWNKDALEKGDCHVLWGSTNNLATLCLAHERSTGLESHSLFPLAQLFSSYKSTFMENGALTLCEVKEKGEGFIFQGLMKSKCQSFFLVYHFNMYFQLMEIDVSGPSFEIRWGDSINQIRKGDLMPDRVRSALKAYFTYWGIPMPSVTRIDGYPEQSDGTSCGLCCLAASKELADFGIINWTTRSVLEFRYEMAVYLLLEVNGKEFCDLGVEEQRLRDAEDAQEEKCFRDACHESIGRLFN